jgi:hypothetical protein
MTLLKTGNPDYFTYKADIMNYIKLILACMVIMGSATSNARPPQEQVIFNGKDLSGWNGDFNWWTVEDGALTAESKADKLCEKSNYLVWTGGQPADFQFDCDFKLSQDGNSGIQIRSETRPDFDTYGYQADMTGNGDLIGYVYHHKHKLVAERGEKVILSAQGTRTATRFAEKETLLEHYKEEEWNHYRIVCKGQKITLSLNGVVMCEITDLSQSGTANQGIIALQMHRGPPMKVQFKNITIKYITPDEQVTQSKP